MAERKVSISVPPSRPKRNSMTSTALLGPARPQGASGAKSSSGRRVPVKRTPADGMLLKDEIQSYMRERKAEEGRLKKDGSTQTTESSKQSPVVEQFCKLVKGAPFLDFPYFRDWLELAGRIEELDGVITKEEILAQFAYHFGNMLEHQVGRQGQSLLSKIQETEVERRVERIQREFEEKAKQEEIANREKLRAEIAQVMEQARQANTITSHKEIAQLKLEQALYNSTLTTLRAELTQREERIDLQEAENEELREEVQALGHAFAGVRESKEQAIIAAEQRSVAHTQENEIQLTKMGNKLVEQGETLLRYHNQLQVMRRDFQTQAARVASAHQSGMEALRGMNASLQEELDCLHKKHVDLVKDHANVTGRQTHVLATLAKNNLLMVERQHRPSKLRMRLGATTETRVSKEERRPSTARAREKLTEFQPVRDPVLHFTA